MATFPSTVKYGWRDLTEAPESVVERTQMERGIPKQRRVRSDVRVELQLTLEFDSKAEVASFETWFYTDIKAGQEFFDFVHPRTGATVQARFVEGGLGELRFRHRILEQSTRTVRLEYWRAAW